MTDKDLCRDLLSFIEKSPSCFHVIANIKSKLDANGFVELKESMDWDLTEGGGYYIVRNDSSVVAFRIPEEAVNGFHMVASHSDSPTFKIKERPEKESEKQYMLLNTEKYGGMILSTWLDRPLSVAGRIVVKQEDETLITKLVNIDKDFCVIPNLAVHMNSEINKGMEYNPQVDMLPLCGQSKKDADNWFLEEIAEAAGVQADRILGQDLYLYVRQKGCILGREGEYLLSPKLDDLQCVFASVEAFVQSKPQNYISVCAVFDNEEVGSSTKQGADSDLLNSVLERICDAMPEALLKGRRSRLKEKLLADSFLISADNAHGVHPNHPQKADPTNRPYLNGGIVIKFHGGQKYTTDAVSAARIKAMCRKAGMEWQTYANRSDIPGGSTLGNISNTHVSVSSADIGLAQLAMHSAVETAGAKDLADAVKLFNVFFAE